MGKKINELTEITEVPSSSYILVDDGTLNNKVTKENLMKDYLPLSGGTLSGNLTVNGNILIPNNNAYMAKDTSGNQRAVVQLASDNRTYLGNENLQTYVKGTFTEIDSAVSVYGDLTVKAPGSANSKLIIYSNEGKKFILTTPYRSSATGDVTVTLPTGSGTIAVGAFIPLSGTTTVSGSISPNLDNKYALGSSSKRWSTVYSSGGCVTSSDSKLKENIKMVPKSKEVIPYTTDVDIEESVCSEDLYNYVKNTGVYTYNLKNTERNTLGVLADEIPENIFMKIGEYSKTEEEYQDELIRREELLKINETLDVTGLQDDSMVLDTGLSYGEFKGIIENEVEEPVRLLDMSARIAMLQEVLGIALNKIDALEEEVRTLKEN